MVHTKTSPETSRRQFLQRSGAVAVGATVLSQSIPSVHAAENNTIRLSLIGCGGRGNGAVVNALNTSDQGPIELYAMADLDEGKIETSLKPLNEEVSRMESTCRRTAFSWDSKRTKRRLTHCDQAISPSARRGHTSDRCTLNMQSSRESMSSWKSRSRLIRLACGGCSRPANWPIRKVSRLRLVFSVGTHPRGLP